jgi:hypothetical protein
VNGNLAAGETLRLMELATQDTPDQMQQGLASFSECASVGMAIILLQNLLKLE